jgi:FkbM family methyltransferase
MRSKYLYPSWWTVALKQFIGQSRSRIFFRQKTISKLVEGERITFFIGDPTGDSWYNNQNDSNAEIRYIKEFLEHTNHSCIIECGSHHGMTTILLSKWAKNGTIYAFEPVPGNVDILRKNIDLNDCTNVIVIGKVVGSSDGVVKIKNQSNSAVRSDRSTGLAVQCISVDQFCSEALIRPDIIKIDVEGFEIDVLKGARDVLAQHPGIFIEIHSEILSRYGQTVSNVWEHIDRTAYDIWIQRNDDRPPVPYRGEAIKTRVHLFCRPLSWGTRSDKAI